MWPFAYFECETLALGSNEISMEYCGLQVRLVRFEVIRLLVINEFKLSQVGILFLLSKKLLTHVDLYWLVLGNRLENTANKQSAFVTTKQKYVSTE